MEAVGTFRLSWVKKLVSTFIETILNVPFKNLQKSSDRKLFQKKKYFDQKPFSLVVPELKFVGLPISIKYETIFDVITHYF